MEVIIATKNKGKINEFKEMFSTLNIKVKSLYDFTDLPLIIEDKMTFKDNAIKKAWVIAHHLNKIVIADDSGLEVQALNNAPGIYSKRYANTGNDIDNNRLLIKNLQGITNRTARYVCAIAIVKPNGEEYVFEDYFYGEIIDEPRGVNGFGYDPHFYLKDYHKTVAELDMKDKNKISHRAKALKQLLENIEVIF